MAVVVLGVLAGVKLVTDRSGSSLGPQVAGATAPDGMVDVKIWLPGDAQAAIGSHYVLGSGR